MNSVEMTIVKFTRIGSWEERGERRWNKKLLLEDNFEIMTLKLKTSYPNMLCLPSEGHSPLHPYLFILQVCPAVTYTKIYTKMFTAALFIT